MKKKYIKQKPEAIRLEIERGLEELQTLFEEVAIKDPILATKILVNYLIDTSPIMNSLDLHEHIKVIKDFLKKYNIRLDKKEELNLYLLELLEEKIIPNGTIIIETEVIKGVNYAYLEKNNLDFKIKDDIEIINGINMIKYDSIATEIKKRYKHIFLLPRE